jgi:exopolysaccharide biosynthesis polyprenyl glycosylphosphotransferase
LRSLTDDRTREIVDRRAGRSRRLRRRGALNGLFAVTDAAALLTAFLVADLGYNAAPSGTGAFGWTTELWLFLLTLPGWILVARRYSLYAHDVQRADHSAADDAPAVLNMVTVGVWSFYGLARFSGIAQPNLTKLFVFWALAITFLLTFRLFARFAMRRRLAYIQNTVIVGAGDVGQLVGKKLLHHPEYGMNLVGFVDDDPRRPRHDLGNLNLFGSPELLPEIVSTFDVERVIVAFSREPHERTLDLVRSLTEQDVQVDIVPRLFEVMRPDMDVHSVEGMPLLGLAPVRLSRSARTLKRVMDVVGAALSLVLLAPFFGVVAALIKLDSRGPVFFRQMRVGEDGTLFRIWKFRTMTVDADSRKQEVAHLNKHRAPGGDPRMFKIPSDPRTTRVGSPLRRYSLDELPQLLNVLAGEMSLVGPRPLIPEESQYVNDWARRRLALRPGITGLWQVLGRSDIPFDEMVSLDYMYINTWSLWNDCRLLARTVPVVLRSKGGY